MHNISYGGLTKSWRLTSRKCDPLRKSQWAQLYDTHDRNGDKFHDKSHPHIFNITFNFGLWWFRNERCDISLLHLIGYSQSKGEFVARKATCSDYYFYEPIRKSLWPFPPWDTNVPIKCASQSSVRGKDGGLVVIVFTGISSPASMSYRRWYGCNWIRYDCTVLDPYVSNQQFMQFTNVVEFKGKFYTLSLQGSLAVIEEIDSQLRITALGTNRTVPTFSRRFREYLFESDGEVLLVFLISSKSTETVDDVEVFRLSFGRLAWVKIERLGDRTLFVGTNSCVFVCPSKVGCKSNCVYFTRISFDGRWMFDMERGRISPGWTEGNSTTKSPVWDEPIED